MQARKLKEILNTTYTIQETEDKICISSYYVTDLISINKKTLALNYALDTFHEGINALKSEELEKIWDKLTEMIKDNTIRDIINNNDSIDGMKKFYYFDHNSREIIESYTDKYSWPNVDYTGKLIYDNNCFTNKQDAVKYGIECLLIDIKYANQNIQTELENFNNRLNRYTTTIKNSQEALEKLQNIGK